MKFRVEHDALADAVAWVARALPSRPVVPVLAGLRLEAGEDLTLSCFDYDLSATARVAAEVAEPGTALVPGRLLAEIIRSLPGQPAEFAADGDVVSLTCGGAEFALVSLPLADYPELPPIPPVAGTIDGGELAAAVAQVLPGGQPRRHPADADGHLPGHPGRLHDAGRHRPVPAGRAGRALGARPAGPARDRPGPGAHARRRGQDNGARGAGAGGFHPRGRAGGRADPQPARERDPQPVEGMISFECGGRRLTGRLIGGEFIRYRSRFPAEYGCRADMPAGPFIEAVRRVSLVADRASPVRLTFSQDRVVIEAQTEGRARAVEAVTASFEGDEPAIAFNPHYLLDGLMAAAAGSGAARQPASGRPGGHGRHAGSGGAAASVRLEFTSPAKPALITLAGAGRGAGGPRR